jgi:ABC-type glycerol-3-phosphate transport system substrate-binding protein
MLKKTRGRRNGWVQLLATALMMAACAGSPSSPTARSAEASVRVVGAWSGVEQQRFQRVLDFFERSSGFQVVYRPAPNGVPALLASLKAAGRLPDVAFLPQPGLLRQYAQTNLLVSIDKVAGSEVRRSFSAVWQQLGSVDGHLYGVWFKAADKSLIWYNIGAFEKAGVVPPHSFDGLLAVAARLRQSGIVPFAVGGADGWTLTDWFENIYLITQGPQRYDRLAEHRIPWTDDSVKATLRLLAAVMEPGNVAGGPEGALRTTFDRSVTETFSSPPEAAMVFEGDFVAGVVTGMTSAQLGVDADVFSFPTLSGGTAWVDAGGDVAVLMSQSSAAAALIRFLASAQAGRIWAAMGGFVSPNLNVDPAVYPDDITRSIALNVIDASDSLRFDLSDLQPAQFGATRGQGLFKELQLFLVHRNVDSTAARLEAEATAAYGSS